MNRVTAVIAGIVIAAFAAPTVAAQKDDQVAKGMKVYEQQKCSVCHSIEGKGNKKGPLDGVGSKLSADEIRQWIVNAKEMTAKTKSERKPPMKDYSLPKEELDALVAYMQSLKKK
ncbi:MAG TPA: cytochrome c [Vicinamibacterales bacterium]|jgi:mono/diheme cytochrome c family protein|nr:cytochrome c [Vicinamibacterales bacterium]